MDDQKHYLMIVSFENKPGEHDWTEAYKTREEAQAAIKELHLGRDHWATILDLRPWINR